MKTFIIALKTLFFFTILTGVIYPLLVTGLAQLLFPAKANGSIIYQNSKPIGSELLGQKFDSSIYFSSRPSVVSYNPLPSGGSNYGLSSKVLKQQVIDRKKKFLEFNNLAGTSKIPSEMLFASASGLDPDISKEAAMLQIKRIVTARHFNEFQKQKLLECISRQTKPPQFLCLGEERVNVLLLNLDVDTIK